MKKTLTVLLAGLLIVALAGVAVAWEFNIRGDYEYRFRYVGRTGGTDLFGIASLQDTALIINDAGFPVTSVAFNGLESNTVGFAGPTLYNRGLIPAWASDSANVGNGGRPRTYSSTNVPFQTAQALGSGAPPLLITRGGFSKTGPDAFLTESRFTLYPEFRITPAIRVFGVYNIGGYRNKYFQNGSQGVPLDFNALANAGLQGEATTGGVGLPPFERYYSSQTSMNAYDTAAVGSWEQFRATVQIPWGLLSMGVKDFPFGVGATLANNTRAEEFLVVVPYGPFRFIYGIWFSRARFIESWNTTPDGDLRNKLFQGGAFTYEAGDLNVGAITIWRQFHQKAIDSAFSGLLGGPVNGLDDNTWVNLVYLKYFNGRFFLNTEYAWVNADQYRLGVRIINGVQVDPRNSANLHLEAYHLFNELGTICGPAKLSLVYALTSGRVLNNNNITKVFTPFAINYQAMQPYQYLMFDTFAGGNNGGWNATDVTFVSDEHGMMTDAYAYAARLDYAVASNLNVWASYIWAHRLERAGWLAGQTDSSGALARDPNGLPWTPALAQQWKALNTGGVAAGLNPYVDNGYLGWEANAGVDWKLLEGMTTYFRYSYWQPGDWFDQAYQAVGIRGATPTNNALLHGRDAIQAFTGSVAIDF